MDLSDGSLDLSEDVAEHLSGLWLSYRDYIVSDYMEWLRCKTRETCFKISLINTDACSWSNAFKCREMLMA